MREIQSIVGILSGPRRSPSGKTQYRLEIEQSWLTEGKRVLRTRLVRTVEFETSTKSEASFDEASRFADRITKETAKLQHVDDWWWDYIPDRPKSRHRAL